MASMLGRAEEAATLVRSVRRPAVPAVRGPAPPASLERFIGEMDALATVRAALTPEAFAAAVERGRRMSLDQAVALVAELGDVAAVSGGPSVVE